MQNDGLLDLLLVILSSAFGLWAVVVGLAARAVLVKVDRATATFRDGFNKLDREITEYIRITESRLARLEEWQAGVNRRLKD